jgi:hypothetical protein
MLKILTQRSLYDTTTVELVEPPPNAVPLPPLELAPRLPKCIELASLVSVVPSGESLLYATRRVMRKGAMTC